jgi:hypothetical protein
MAKDVVFESEKYMQRQEAKRKWLPLIALAAILLVVIIAALILRGSRSATVKGGEDTPYPYSWSVNKKGELTLQIDRSAAEGYTWMCSDYDVVNLTVTRPEKEAANVSSFTIMPNAPGRYITTFSLVNKTDRDDCLYEWRFLMDSASAVNRETVSAGPLSIISGTGMELGGKQRSGEDEAVAYTVHTDADGGMVVEIINPKQGESSAPGTDAIITDKDEGDVVSAEKRGEGDGGKPDETGKPAGNTEAVVIDDPEEIAAIEAELGMTIQEWVEMQQAEAEEDADARILYDYSWIVTSDNENAAVPAGCFYTGEMVIASLNAGSEPGTASIRVSNDVLGLEVHAMVENKDGKLSITSYGSSRYEPVVQEPGGNNVPAIPGMEGEEGQETNEEAPAEAGAPSVPPEEMDDEARNQLDVIP